MVDLRPIKTTKNILALFVFIHPKYLYRFVKSTYKAYRIFDVRRTISQGIPKEYPVSNVLRTVSQGIGFWLL